MKINLKKFITTHCIVFLIKQRTFYPIFFKKCVINFFLSLNRILIRFENIFYIEETWFYFLWFTCTLIAFIFHEQFLWPIPSLVWTKSFGFNACILYICKTSSWFCIGQFSSFLKTSFHRKTCHFRCLPNLAVKTLQAFKLQCIINQIMWE